MRTFFSVVLYLVAFTVFLVLLIKELEVLSVYYQCIHTLNFVCAIIFVPGYLVTRVGYSRKEMAKWN